MISAWGVDDGDVSKASFPRIGAKSVHAEGLSSHSPFFVDEAMNQSAPKAYRTAQRAEGMRSAKGKHAQRVGSFFKPKGK